MIHKMNSSKRITIELDEQEVADIRREYAKRGISHNLGGNNPGPMTRIVGKIKDATDREAGDDMSQAEMIGLFLDDVTADTPVEKIVSRIKHILGK